MSLSPEFKRLLEQAAAKASPANGEVKLLPAVQSVHDEYKRKAGIEDWETNELTAVAREIRRVEPAISPDDMTEALLAAVNRTDEHSSRPPPWLEMAPSEIEGSIAAVVGVIYPVAKSNGNGHSQVTEYQDRWPIDAFAAFTAMQADQRGYSVKGLIKEGCTALLSGLMGGGKTTLAMNFARGWGLGTSVLGRDCKQSKTLVVVSPKEYEAWADTIGFWGLKGLVFLIESTKAHFPTHDATVRWFDFVMQQFGCRTFILDTLFDFFGMPPHNGGDQNRIVMNEQAPLLQCARERMYSGLLLGHAPKSEAQALMMRDPEESFGGHTAWAAQHRMRMVVRRKSQGINAFITGRGGYGDEGVLREEMLLFDADTRLVDLGGPFANYLGAAALPSVLAVLDGWMSRSDIEKATGKGKTWVQAGCKEGIKKGAIKHNRKKGRAGKYARPEEPEQDELFG